MECFVSLPNSVVIEIEADLKESGQYCIDQVCHKLGILEQDYFGLQYRGAKGELLWLNLRNRLDRQLFGTPPFRLQLRVKFFVEPHNLLQQTTRALFYQQVKMDLESQKLIPESDDQIKYLAALIALAEYGEYDPRTHQLNSYKTLLGDIHQPSSQLLHSIAEMHKSLVGTTRESAQYKFLQEASKLPNYGVEYHEAKDCSGETVTVGIGPDGVFRYDTNMELIEKVTFEMITKAVHTRKCCVLKVQNDNGLETEVVLKLCTPSAANALYRSLTEMHSFYLCDTVHNEVSMQFSRDLKGTLASIFNENTTLGMEYVFDIKRTSREALDHARRSLYKPEEENCGQCDKERMDVSENANCDIEESQAKKCQALEDKLVRLEESFLCCVCRDADISTAMCPCGHVTCCSECSEKLTECPLCRVKIDHVQRIFLPTHNLLKRQSSQTGNVQGPVGLSKL